VEQAARARDVTQLTCVELRQPVLGRADVQRYTNRETCGFSVFFHRLYRGLWPSVESRLIETKVLAAGLYSRHPLLTLQALPSCGLICTDGMRGLMPVSL
jgi:hypothetical protein